LVPALLVFFRRSRTWCAIALLVGCHRDDKLAPTKAEFERVRAAYQKKVAEQKHPPVASARPIAGEQAPGNDEPDEAPAPRPASSHTAPSDAPWIADAPVVLSTAAQATATPRGVVFNTRDGGLVLTRLGPLPRGPAGKTPLIPLPDSAGPFALGRGPSVGADYVYWISHGTLVRRAFPLHGPMGALEVLARDAFDGTRVAVPSGPKPAATPETVAYIVRPEKDDGPLLAKLWVEGQESELLTAEGNSTHSAALVRTNDGVLALSVQARMAMTPVHARRIRFASGHPLLGDDTVVWVGGGIQPLTEMTVLQTGDSGLIGLIPHERSMSEFGLARLDIGMNPTMDTPTTWMLYPNGIDPAPVAAAHLCGEPAFLYSAPEAAAPDSPQQVALRALSDTAGSHSLPLGSSRAFYFTSLAEVPGGALAVWVTGGGVSAATVRCQNRPK
jgi:hypothetical protein